MKFKFRIKDAVRLPMTIAALPFGQDIEVTGVGMYITADKITELQAKVTNTIGTMDDQTLGFFDPFKLHEISTT